jgi:hypothetical protein
LSGALPAEENHLVDPTIGEVAGQRKLLQRFSTLGWQAYRSSVTLETLWREPAKQFRLYGVASVGFGT